MELLFLEKFQSNVKIYSNHKMDNANSNILYLLELPGLSNLINGYSKTSIKLNNQYANTVAFVKTNQRYNTVHIFCYGNIELKNPSRMFSLSIIETFTSKGTISLTGNSSRMFYEAVNFNSDLSKWNVSNVTDTCSMFDNAIIFESDLSRWDLKKCKDMNFMFYQAVLFDSDLSRWDVSNVKSSNHMFDNAVHFNSDLSNWDMGNCEDMNFMFHEAVHFNSDLSNWEVGNVESDQHLYFVTESFDRTLLPNF